MAPKLLLVQQRSLEVEKQSMNLCSRVALTNGFLFQKHFWRRSYTLEALSCASLITGSVYHHPLTFIWRVSPLMNQDLLYMKAMSSIDQVGFKFNLLGWNSSRPYLVLFGDGQGFDSSFDFNGACRFPGNFRRLCACCPLLNYVFQLTPLVKVLNFWHFRFQRASSFVLFPFFV